MAIIFFKFENFGQNIKFQVSTPLLAGLGVPDFSWDIISVNVGFLQEHMKATFVLSQRMASNFVDEALQPRPSVLDKVFLINSIISTEGKLSF